MDFKKVVLFLLFSFSSSFSQENYLVELKLYLREEKVPSILNYIVYNAAENLQITSSDVIHLYKLDQLDLDTSKKVFNYYNLTSEEVFNLNNLKKLLKSLDMSYLDFHQKAISECKLEDGKLMQVTNSLKIPTTFWMIISLNDDAKTYEVLSQGKYDSEHFTAALDASGKTGNEVFVGVRNVILEKMTQLSTAQFLEVLAANGWDNKTSLSAYKALDITTSNIYEVEKFRNIFTNISEELNKNVSVAVFVAPNKVAVHELVYLNLVKYVDGVNVRIDADGVEVNLETNGLLGPNIRELATNQTRSNYIEIVGGYNATEECTYVSVVDGRIVEESVEVVDFAIEKTPTTVFTVGNPLICDGLLYGLASEENETSIIFAEFYTEQNPPSSEATPHEINSASSLIYSIVTLNLLIFTVLL